MKLYHGTEKTFSSKVMTLPNQIDRTKGGGELGMGFYVGDNLVLAVIFAKGKFGNDASVIEFEIVENEFAKLNLLVVKTRSLVLTKWRWIISQKKRFTYIYNADVVMSPFATIEICLQYKFESVRAENFINATNKNLIL
jgi:hypothetical protein